MKHLFYLSCFLCLSTLVEAQEIRLPERPQNRTTYRDYSVQSSGYWNSVEFFGGSTVMFNRKNAANVGLTWVNGYRFNEFLKVGVGIGGRYYINNDNLRTSSTEWTFPIFADVRGNIISQQDRGAVPYWSIDLGGEINGGVYFSPSLGYRFGADRSSLTLGIAYQLMQTDTWKKKNECLNGVVAKIGYEF